MTFEPNIRQNWGFWDGVAASKRGQYPVWCKSYNYRGRHPFDKSYGEAFWAGYYKEAHPVTKLFACHCGNADADSSGKCKAGYATREEALADAQDTGE